MGRIRFLLAAILFSWSVAGAANATPIYYTATVKISVLDTPSGTDYGHSVNDELTYIWKTDRASNDYSTRYRTGGNLVEYDNSEFDFFVPYLILGNYLPFNESISPRFPDISSYTYNYDYGWVEQASGIWYFMEGNDNHNIGMYLQPSNGNFVSIHEYNNYYVGDVWVADSMYAYGAITSISNINPLNPVPEPSTMLLLGGGIAGLAFWKRRKSVK